MIVLHYNKSCFSRTLRLFVGHELHLLRLLEKLQVLGQLNEGVKLNAAEKTLKLSFSFVHFDFCYVLLMIWKWFWYLKSCIFALTEESIAYACKSVGVTQIRMLNSDLLRGFYKIPILTCQSSVLQRKIVYKRRRLRKVLFTTNLNLP